MLKNLHNRPTYIGWHIKRPQLCNDIVRLNSRIQKMTVLKSNHSWRARFRTFSANRCDWISISCSETCWTYWLFCTVRTPNTVLRISLLKQKTKGYKVIVLVSHAVQLWLLFKTVISFCLNSTVEPYNIIANLGTFFMSHPVLWL